MQTNVIRYSSEFLEFRITVRVGLGLESGIMVGFMIVVRIRVRVGFRVDLGLDLVQGCLGLYEVTKKIHSFLPNFQN